MISGIRNLLAKKLQRQLIEIAVSELYSERFELEPLIKRLSSKGGDASTLRAYISVQVAAKLTEPLTDEDVARAQDVIRIWESHSSCSAFPEIVSAHRNLAEMFWMQRHLAILRGKLAHKEKDSSLAGTIYSMQRDKKGPVAKADIAKFEEVCQKMEDLDRQIEEAELEAWKEQDAEEYERYKEELEIRSLESEIAANEDEVIKQEHDEAVDMIYEELLGFLDTSRFRAEQVAP